MSAELAIGPTGLVNDPARALREIETAAGLHPKRRPIVYPACTPVVCIVCGQPLGLKYQSPAVRGPDGKLRHKQCPGRGRR